MIVAIFRRRLREGATYEEFREAYFSVTTCFSASRCVIGVANVKVSTQPPTVLSAPVKGGVWYISEGCCRDDTHHGRGLAPDNGQLMVPQRFAIDFYKLDDQYRTWVGDPKKLDSYLTYRQPIIAAAAGTVVRAEDGLPKSTAVPKPPPIPPITQTVGIT